MKWHIMVKTMLALLIITAAYSAIDDRVASRFNKFFHIGASREKLPGFDITLLDGSKKIYTDDLKFNEAFVILYFSPECPFCKEQLHEIMKNNSKLNNIPIYFLSPYSAESVKEYFKEYDLNNYKNLTAAIDNSSHFVKYYNIRSIPCLAFYDKYKDLKKIKIGVTETNIIKSVCDSINNKLLPD